MAKRHKHYDGRTRRGGGRGGATMPSKRKSSHKDTHIRKKDNWFNSSVPMGFDGDDLSPELVNAYYFGKPKSGHSMRMGSQRPGQNRDETNYGSQLSFKKRPMVFIRAKEVYDPSHDLIKQLATKQGQNKIVTEVQESSSQNSFTEDELSNGTTLENESEVSDSNDDSADEMASKQNDALFFVDNEGYVTNSMPKVKTVKVDEVKKVVDDKREFNPVITVGKIQMNIMEEESEEAVKPELQMHPFSRYIANVTKPFQDDDDEDDIDSDEENYDEFIQEEDLIKSKNFVEEAFENFAGGKQGTTAGNLSENFMNLHMSGEEDAESINSTPDFGMLDEDYVINTTETSVTNIRLGAVDNSYFLKSYQLFGDYEFRWVEEAVLSEHITEDIGLPEGRLSAYLRFVKDSIIPKCPSPEPQYDNIPISDSEDENEEESGGSANGNLKFEDNTKEGPFQSSDEEITEDMKENLNDLISYSMKLETQRNREYETKSLNIKGKGKKKTLVIDEDSNLDKETIEILQTKLKTRLANKAQKRNEKSFIDIENRKSTDLFVKYPQGLHVLNIKDELDGFYHDHNRESIAFPPLDPHGNKTITRMASFYYMKCQKQGNGNKTHVVVQKTKKAYYNDPFFDRVESICRQRPIFMRIDIRKLREEHESRTERIRLQKGTYSVKEGAIVGEDAPVIDQSNIGRRLLQKLGWSEGEGLGVHGNKGISEPLFATVKKSKTGLRHKKEDQDTDSTTESSATTDTISNTKTKRRHRSKRH